MNRRTNYANAKKVSCKVCNIELKPVNLIAHNKTKRHLYNKDIADFIEWEKGNVAKVLQLQELVRRSMTFDKPPFRITWD